MSFSSGGRAAMSVANKPNMCERNFLSVSRSFDRHIPTHTHTHVVINMSTFSVGRQYSRGCQRYIDVAFIIQFDFFFSSLLLLFFFYCWYSVDRTALRSSFILMRARSMVVGRTVAVWVHIYFSRFVVFIYILRSPLPPPSLLSRNRFLFFRFWCVCVSKWERACRGTSGHENIAVA